MQNEPKSIAQRLEDCRLLGFATTNNADSPESDSETVRKTSLAKSGGTKTGLTKGGSPPPPPPQASSLV